MKFLLQIFCFLISFLVLVNCSSAPDAYDSQGHSINLRDYKGKWLIVNFWAAWCEPCREEMPVLENLSQVYAKNIVVLGVNFDQQTPKELHQLAQEFKVSYPLLSEFPLKKWGIEAITVVPTTLIINPEGKLVHTLFGPQSKEELLKLTHTSQ